MDPTQHQFRMFIQAASRRSQRSDGSSHYGSQPAPPQIDDSVFNQLERKSDESPWCRKESPGAFQNGTETQRKQHTRSFKSGQGLSSDLSSIRSARRSLNFDSFATKSTAGQANHPYKNSSSHRVPFRAMKNSSYGRIANAEPAPSKKDKSVFKLSKRKSAESPRSWKERTGTFQNVSGQDLSSVSTKSARRSLNFDSFASKLTAGQVNNPCKNSSIHRVPFHEMTISSYGNVANARTTDWILQQNHAKYNRCRLTDLSNTRVKSSNLSSTVATPPIYRSLKSHSASIKGNDKSLRKLISDSTGSEEMIDLDSISSYCKENVVKASHQQYRKSVIEEREQISPSLASTKCKEQNIIALDHPYTKVFELSVSPSIMFKDASTSLMSSARSVVCNPFEQLSGIVTLRSSNGDDENAQSSRIISQSEGLSGIDTLRSSVSYAGTPWKTYTSKLTPKPIPNRVKHERLHTFSEDELMSCSKKRFHQGAENKTFEYTLCSNVSPTFSKVVTSTPRERSNINKDIKEYCNIESDAFIHPANLGAARKPDKNLVLNKSGINYIQNCSELGFEKPKDGLEDALSSDDDSQSGSQDECVAGNHDFLNDLTIFEYFEKYNSPYDDHEILSSNAPLDDNDQVSSHDVVNEPVEPGSDIIDILDKESLKVKKRKENPKLMNKNRKERGLKYVRKDGTVVPARQVKPPCGCRMKCYEKYSEPIRQKLLTNLLRLKSDSQNQFLANHITVQYTSRPQVVNSKRNYTYVYRMPSVNGTIKVCKRMFQATFDIGSRKIRVLREKIIAGSGVPADDGRQQNCNRRPVSQEHLDYIRQHILSFPAYSSHYTRNKSTKLYLSSHLTIRRMHELYQDKCAADNLIPSHYNTYRLIFKSYNLGFKKPKSDTCGKCDRLMMQIKTELDPSQKEELKLQLENHQKAAQRVYEEKRKDIDRSKTDSSIRTSSFDLQKQLATPYLRNGQAFYSRQLYTYNLTVFTSYLDENGAVCFLWDETKGKRGAREIGSCLLQDLHSIPSTVETAIYYSDRCPGQNNNKTIIFLFSYFIELMKNKGRKLQIIHKFMHSGHSHMEVDSVHGSIEKAVKKNIVDIEIPHDWAIFISSIRRRVPFKVVELDQREILNINLLESRYSIPKKSISGQPFRMTSTMEFRYSTEIPGMVEYKADILDETYDSIQILTDVEADIRSVTLHPVSDKPMELPTVKLEDLRKLMPYIKKKEYYATFLKTLVPPKKGRRGKNTVPDHFEADLDPTEESENELSF